MAESSHRITYWLLRLLFLETHCYLLHKLAVQHSYSGYALCFKVTRVARLLYDHCNTACSLHSHESSMVCRSLPSKSWRWKSEPQGIKRCGDMISHTSENHTSPRKAFSLTLRIYDHPRNHHITRHERNTGVALRNLDNIKSIYEE